jgi:predicted DCC family thiol-disulfide oxidoreductase YuxK
VNDVVLFDGVCNLCNRSVKFILNHESTPRLMFVPLQSAAGTRIMRQHGFSPDDVKTFVLVLAGAPYIKSDAAIQISRFLRKPWSLLRALGIVPRSIRNWGYDLVAKNRYRWFGRTESCMVPTPELRARFIED